MSRIIIVTGGAGILGRAVCKAIEAKGWTAAPVDIADQVEGGLGGVDLTDEGAVTSAYARIAATHGRLDGVANIAGGFIWETIADGKIESFDRMYQMNLRSAVNSCRAALEHLGEGASLVNVGAAAAGSAGLGMASYAASKAGVMALTKSLSEELSGKGIRVNAVLPTILDTPANRKDMPDADTSEWVTPDDAASVVAFLLSKEAHAVTGAAVRLAMGRKG